MNIEEYRRSKKKDNKSRLILKNKVRVFLNKVLIVIIVFLCAMIAIKRNPSYKKVINKYLYEESIHFTKFKDLYNKYFGKYVGEIDDVKDVFSEKISYSKDSIYKDGVKLEVSNNYLVPAIESGIITFMGEKEEYGYTVIVEQINGINVWYSNINPKNVKMYDYIKKGDLIAEASSKYIYLLFEKKGKFLDYKKYI